MKDLSKYINQLSSRGAPPIELSSTADTVQIGKTDEIGAVVVGLLVLDRLASHGGTRFSTGLLRQLCERLTSGLDRADAMTLEVETYDMLRWFAQLSNEEKELETATEGAIPYDPETSVIALIDRAIDERFDIVIQYYTPSLDHVTERTVSPVRVAAEEYLLAFCRLCRKRVYKLSRIVEAKPVGGVVVVPKEIEPGQGELF